MLCYHCGVAGLAPHQVVNHLAIEYLPGALGKKCHNVEVFAGELNDVFAHARLAPREVNGNATREPHGCAVERAPLACDLRFHAGAEHLERERLCHVVVASCGEACYGIGVFHARGEEDNGARDAFAYLAAHLEAVAVGEVHVEQDNVGRVPSGLRCLRGARCDERAVAFEGEVIGEHVCNVSLVFHNEHKGRLARCAAARFAFHWVLLSMRIGRRSKIPRESQQILNFGIWAQKRARAP